MAFQCWSWERKPPSGCGETVLTGEELNRKEPDHARHGTRMTLKFRGEWESESESESESRDYLYLLGDDSDHPLPAATTVLPDERVGRESVVCEGEQEQVLRQ